MKLIHDLFGFNKDLVSLFFRILGTEVPKYQYVPFTVYGSLIISDRSNGRTVAVLNWYSWLARPRSQLIVILFLFKKLPSLQVVVDYVGRLGTGVGRLGH